MNLHLVILLYSENTGCLDYLGEKSLASGPQIIHGY